MEATQMHEPWSTLILLTLFLLYIMLAGAVSVLSFLPERAAESESLRRVSFVVGILLAYCYALKLWSVLPTEMTWMPWILFSALSIYILLSILDWRIVQNQDPNTLIHGLIGHEKAGL